MVVILEVISLQRNFLYKWGGECSCHGNQRGGQKSISKEDKSKKSQCVLTRTHAWAAFVASAWQCQDVLASFRQARVMTCLCPLGVTAVILTTTLLITALGAAIIGLILKMQRGKLLRQNKDVWWQIRYDDITILPQNKVRTHLAQTSFLLTAGDLWRGLHLGAYESRG